MTDLDLTFTADGRTFGATLTLPDGGGPCPGALLIPGSGPIDRDENTKRAKLAVFSQLAAHLAARGIATLRYDKRGIGASEGDYWTCGFHDNAHDAAAALAALRARPEVAGMPVYVVGHSEGALHAATLGARGHSIDGVVLLAGPATSGEAVLLWQGRTIAAALTGFRGWLIRTLRIDIGKQQRKLFAKIRASDKATMRVQLVAKINARWMREFLDHDPAADLSRLTVPTLAITGDADVQVPPDDLECMRALNPAHIETVRMPGLSHLLRLTDRRDIADYRRQFREPLAAPLLQALDAWFERRHDTGAGSA